jgi:hypothetical protein
MDLTNKRLEILDKVIRLDLTVDDLRRILMLFRYIKYQMQGDVENSFGLYDDLLIRGLENQYSEFLRMEGINCI